MILLLLDLRIWKIGLSSISQRENRLQTRIQNRMNDFLASGVEFKALMRTQ